MAMAGSFLRALAMILAFSHLICWNTAVPVTRSRSLLHAIQPSENTKLAAREELVWNEKVVERLGVEIDDYPGSGANNRHTPRAQSARGCVDC
ncbi:hypothetical protein Ancab_038877 [Ancistrocladus abbreviatus]